MSLPHVILTALSKDASTGYDITKQFSQNIGEYWKASHQQVYRELNKMAKSGLVTCELQPQDGKPDRKVYSITELGRQNLQEWLKKEISYPTIRDELSAKLLACSVNDSEPMRKHLLKFINESTQTLAQYRAIEESQYSNYKMLDRQARLDRLTLRRGILQHQSWIIWAEESLEELSAIDSYENSTANVA
ncbi:PadR family transcriptional regulator [Vibrio sp. SS-MA-C1-2]|uniref:PadR family transcriptional regulator n=1 Tax=Vibrio sp. SS-MA-C1-2 TaxID=2908646 RepID=UPI001F328F70|nr:PadR family transcriptional regulator [Vibrio sp. SS-MA-C1-2]UJF19236.1 PadR family transcriptional regulator [Vibrio sp. SS-MA-C1-2]